MCAARHLHIGAVVENGADVRLEHEVEEARFAELLLSAFGAGDFALDEL